MSYARIEVADRSGKKLAELTPRLGAISWRLNDIGRATFTIDKSDPKATAENLAYLNRILITFDNGLPNWGGILDPPRRWTEHEIEITAYTGEYLLTLRQTDRGRYFTSVSVGYITQSLLNEANDVWATGLMAGSIWTGGSTHSPEYHFANLFKKIRDSLFRRFSTGNFVVTPAETAGEITFSLSVAERLGSEKPGVALLEGHNVTLAELLEQGPIVNVWAIVGEGTTWGDDRNYAYESDAASMSDYGYREGSEIRADVSEQDTLDAIAESLLAEYKDPHSILTLRAANLAPAAFADYTLGDTIRVQLPTYGFEGYDHMVRIYAREYDPALGECNLVVRQDD